MAWYYEQDGFQHGPCSVTQLRRMAETGQLHPDATVWKDGDPARAPAKKVKGLFPAVATPSKTGTEATKDKHGFYRLKIPKWAWIVLAVFVALALLVRHVVFANARLMRQKPNLAASPGDESHPYWRTLGGSHMPESFEEWAYHGEACCIHAVGHVRRNWFDNDGDGEMSSHELADARETPLVSLLESPDVDEKILELPEAPPSPADKYLRIHEMSMYRLLRSDEYRRFVRSRRKDYLDWSVKWERYFKFGDIVQVKNGDWIDGDGVSNAARIRRIYQATLDVALQKRVLVDGGALTSEKAGELLKLQQAVHGFEAGYVITEILLAADAGVPTGFGPEIHTGVEAAPGPTEEVATNESSEVDQEVAAEISRDPTPTEAIWMANHPDHPKTKKWVRENPHHPLLEKWRENRGGKKKGKSR